MKFCTVTLGCKVNQFETQAIESILISGGHTRVALEEGCDVCIINTCAVTEESCRKSRQAVRRVKKIAPLALIAVCGCFTQLDRGAGEALGADIIGGSGNRREFALEIEKLFAARIVPEPHVIIPESRTAFEELPPGGGSGRTRGLIKIQDGCDSFCAYCVIPYARGRSRSLPPDKAEEQARVLARHNYREIVVTGIEISSYGMDLPGKPGLSEVIRVISVAAPLTRLRLASLDPAAVTSAFCGELCKIPNLCDHFHLSMQSGCDGTLLRMGRKYNTAMAIDSIASLRQRYPLCGITADIIVGFPNETDAEFEQTLSFLKAAAFSSVHVFPYSKRPGTRAATFPNQVSKDVSKHRVELVSAAVAETARAFMRMHIGRTVEVLVERESNGVWTGRSSNYLKVAVNSRCERNNIIPVLITGLGNGCVIGELA